MRFVKSGTLRTLSFDIENKPLSYLGKDFTTAEITAVAVGWASSPDVEVHDVEVWALTKDERSRRRMLAAFVKRYNEADIVAGHYVLRHDLPLINGALVEEGLSPLGPKLVSDTYIHLIGFSGISKSQGNLAEMFGIEAPKIEMSTPRWRRANRLTPGGVALTIERVKADVVQHRLLRRALLHRGLLKPPVRWST